MKTTFKNNMWDNTAEGIRKSVERYSCNDATPMWCATSKTSNVKSIDHNISDITFAPTVILVLIGFAVVAPIISRLRS